MPHHNQKEFSFVLIYLKLDSKHVLNIVVYMYNLCLLYRVSLCLVWIRTLLQQPLHPLLRTLHHPPRVPGDLCPAVVLRWRGASSELISPGLHAHIRAAASPGCPRSITLVPGRLEYVSVGSEHTGINGTRRFPAPGALSRMSLPHRTRQDAVFVHPRRASGSETLRPQRDHPLVPVCPGPTAEAIAGEARGL